MLKIEGFEDEESRRLGIVFPPLDPESMRGPQHVSCATPESQLHHDAWIAAGGYENDEFKRFFGIESGEDE